jgi:hypothetical protein
VEVELRNGDKILATTLGVTELAGDDLLIGANLFDELRYEKFITFNRSEATRRSKWYKLKKTKITGDAKITEGIRKKLCKCIDIFFANAKRTN